CRRDRADGRARPALIAEREIVGIEPDDLPLPLEIGHESGRHADQNPFIGFGPTDLITLTNSSSMAGILSDSEMASSITLTRPGSSASRSSVSCTFPIRVCKSSLPRMKWH